MHFRRIAFASLTALVIAVGMGCSGVREGSAEHTQTLQEHLFEGSGVTLWKNGVVPVCYSTADGNNSNLRAQAQTYLIDWGWSAVANIQFTGWGACGSNPIAGGQVKLHFVPGSAQFGGGNTDRSGGGGSVFTNVYLVSDDAVGNSFRHEVLHEFGHVLGWDNEQQSTYNWPNGPDGGEVFCKKNQTGPDGGPSQILDDTKGTALTKYFDGESVMSNCAPNTVGLSAGDVAGVQAAYGLPSYPVRGHNGSNNAVSQNANALNTFFVRNDGSVWTTWGPAAPGKWPEGQLPGAGPGTAADGPIATVSRSPVNLDVFYAGKDGAIHSNYWLSGTPWGSQTIPGTAALATPGQQVAAVSGSPSEIDVFFAGNDQNIYWSRWSGLQSVPGQWTTVKWTGSAPAGAAVSAVARTPDRLDVFYIGTDGAPHWSNCSAFGATGPGTCTAANAGQFGSSTLTASTECLAPPGGGIAATAATANNMDIFYANKNGGICTNSWTVAGGWTNREIVAPAQAHMAKGTVAAVSRQPTTLDVFWIATNSTSGAGEMHTAWGSPGGSAFGTGQNDTNFVGSNPGGAPVPGGPLGVASRTKDNLDEFDQRAASGGAIAQDTSYWFTGASGWSTYTTVVYNWFSESSNPNGATQILSVSNDFGTGPVNLTQTTLSGTLSNPVPPTSTIQITLAGQNVISEQFVGPNASGLSTLTVDYGAAFQGVRHVVMVTDGKTINTTVDGRSLLPFPASAVNDPNSYVFADENPPPVITIANGTNQSISAILSEAKANSNLYQPQTLTGPVVVAGPPVELGHGTDANQLRSCRNCIDGCTAAGGACFIGVNTGCAGALALGGLPGAIVLVACEIIGNVSCAVAEGSCNHACDNTGQGCCPIQCGSGCCDQSETCLDTGLSLCCSAGFTTCLGPKESCVDVKQATCLASGQGCADTPDGTPQPTCGSGHAQVCCPSGICNGNACTPGSNFHITTKVSDPATGPAICVNGTGFTPNAVVTITYTGIPTATGPLTTGSPHVDPTTAQFSFVDTEFVGSALIGRCANSVATNLVTITATDGDAATIGTGATTSTQVSATYWCSNLHSTGTGTCP